MSDTKPTELELRQIDESPTNPRKIFDEKELQDLAASIGAVGVLQAVLVRPRGKRYELVYGARRYRAAKLAGLKSIPANVRELSDQEVLEIQLVENAQRKDVHPLEEAEAYDRLVHPPAGSSYKALTAEEVGAKVGKSRAWVYNRLKLMALTPANRQLAIEGKLDPSRALLVARITDPKLQDEAGKEITREDRYDGPMSYRSALRYIQDRYFLRLADAPFDTKDAGLVPAAGPCGACPKRTGAEPTLFADLAGAGDDTCTDFVCYRAKKEAHGQRVLEAEAAKGREVVTKKKDAEKYFRQVYGGGGYQVSSEFVDLGSKCYQDQKARTYAKVIGKDLAKLPVVVAKDPAGDVHELLPRSVVDKALKAAGIGVRQVSDAEAAYNRKAREAQARAKIEKAAKVVAIAQIGDAIDAVVAGGHIPEWLLRLLIPAISRWSSTAIARRGLVTKGGDELEPHDPEDLEKIPRSQLPGVLLEMALETELDLGGAGGKDWPSAIARAAKETDVDLKAILAEQEASAAPAAKKAAGKKSRKKSAVQAAAAGGEELEGEEIEDEGGEE